MIKIILTLVTLAGLMLMVLTGIYFAPWWFGSAVLATIALMILLVYIDSGGAS